MAGVYDGAVQELIDELGRLPGIGPKSAQRIAFHLLEQEEPEVRALAEAMLRVKERVHFCQICGNVTETDICSLCSDTRRSDAVICVVEEAKDIMVIERTREYRGRYHVLGGSINPIQGIGPEDLRIRELLTRLQDGRVTEVIIATDPNIEGDATAAYLIRLLTPIGIAISRLASGLPVGGDLEYADEITLSRAFEGRTRITSGTTANTAATTGIETSITTAGVTGTETVTTSTTLETAGTGANTTGTPGTGTTDTGRMPSVVPGTTPSAPVAETHGEHN